MRQRTAFGKAAGDEKDFRIPPDGPIRPCAAYAACSRPFLYRGAPEGEACAVRSGTVSLKKEKTVIPVLGIAAAEKR